MCIDYILPQQFEPFNRSLLLGITRDTLRGNIDIHNIN
jgi:hypothetical protein